MQKHLLPFVSMFAVAASATPLKLTILNDGSGSMPNSIFTGADKSVIADLAPEGGTPSVTHVYHVTNGAGKSCLIDTGRGGNLRNELKRIGVAPESINAILLTHSHGDHVGGLLASDGATAVFTNATVYATAAELEFWRKSRPDNIAACEKAYKFVIFAPDEKTSVFMDGVVAVSASGHTPGHVAFLLDTAERKTLVAGDLLHSYLLQLPRPDINASFDNDKPLSAATRKKILERVKAENWIFTAVHLPEQR